MKNSNKTSKWIATFVVGLTVMTALVSASQMAHAAVFVLIEGIDGDVRERGKEKYINAESFSVGTANATSSGVRKRGGTEFQDAELTMKVSQASPKLFEACVSGRIMPKMVVTLTRTDRNQTSDYLTYTLTNCVITNYKVSGNSSQAEEQISIAFEKLEMEITTQDSKTGKDEKIRAEWDRSKK